MIIDAHHHLWEYNERDYFWMTGSMTSLRRNFLADELEEAMRTSGVDATVAVQARQTLAETEWLLQLAERHCFIRGVVGWVPLIDPQVEEQLERFARNPVLKSVRHVLHDEADDFYMLREDFNRGIGLLKRFNLAYDILVFERHLPQTITFVDRHPDQLFILDHIAKPLIREGKLSPWRENIAELGRRPNVYCKLSGLVTEADWKHWKADELRPYFDVVLTAFGPQRLLFGSDWPVVTLACGYRAWMDTAHEFICDLSQDEQQSILGGTAVAAYRLGIAI